MESAECRWVAPLDEEDREYFSYFRTVCKRYNINPSRATRLEYDFVTRVAESEFTCRKLRPDEMVEPHACTLNVWVWGFL